MLLDQVAAPLSKQIHPSCHYVRSFRNLIIISRRLSSLALHRTDCDAGKMEPLFRPDALTCVVRVYVCSVAVRESRLTR